MLSIWIYHMCSIHICIWTLPKWFYLWHCPVCMEILIIHIVWIIDVYTHVKIFTLVLQVSDSMMLLVHIFHIYCNICTRHICDIYVHICDIYVHICNIYVTDIYVTYMSVTHIITIWLRPWEKGYYGFDVVAEKLRHKVTSSVDVAACNSRREISTWFYNVTFPYGSFLSTCFGLYHILPSFPRQALFIYM